MLIHKVATAWKSKFLYAYNYQYASLLLPMPFEFILLSSVSQPIQNSTLDVLGYRQGNVLGQETGLWPTKAKV
jgi:hypothetical protein